MRSITRILVAVGLSVGAAWLPVQTAFACSCGFPGYRDAIAAADVAFVGTVVGEAEPGVMAGDFPTATVAFDVTRAKAPMASPFELEVAFGGDANCGFDMAIGEEWLVIASAHDGRLQTDLCNGTARADGLADDTRLVIDAAFEANDAAGVPADDAFDLRVPTPVLLAIGAIVVLGGVSFLAFRRDPRA